MGVASLARLAVGLSCAGAHRVSLRLSAYVHNYGMFIKTLVGFFWLSGISWDRAWLG